jgi:hypothetical protein
MRVRVALALLVLTRMPSSEADCAMGRQRSRPIDTPHPRELPAGLCFGREQTHTKMRTVVVPAARQSQQYP